MPQNKNILAQYKALPSDLTMQQAANRIGCALNTLEKLKRQAGMTVHPTVRLREADIKLVARWRQLPASMSHATKARLLGVGETALRGSLDRTRYLEPEPVPDEAVKPKQQQPFVDPLPRRGFEALPAGAEETWGAISKDPWPGSI